MKKNVFLILAAMLINVTSLMAQPQPGQKIPNGKLWYKVLKVQANNIMTEVAPQLDAAPWYDDGERPKVK